MKRHLHRSRSVRGFTIIEILVVIAIVGLLTVIAIPILLGSSEKARAAACDENYGALIPEIQVRLDEFLDEGNTDAAEDAVDGLIEGHAVPVAHNPRNLGQDAYADADACGATVPDSSTSCQVFLCFEGTSTVVHQQYEIGGLRTFRITVD